MSLYEQQYRKRQHEHDECIGFDEHSGLAIYKQKTTPPDANSTVVKGRIPSGRRAPVRRNRAAAPLTDPVADTLRELTGHPEGDVRLWAQAQLEKLAPGGEIRHQDTRIDQREVAPFSERQREHEQRRLHLSNKSDKTDSDMLFKWQHSPDEQERRRKAELQAIVREAMSEEELHTCIANAQAEYDSWKRVRDEGRKLEAERTQALQRSAGFARRVR